VNQSLTAASAACATCWRSITVRSGGTSSWLRLTGGDSGSAPRAGRTGNFTYDHDQRAAVTYSYEPNIGRPTATTTAVRLRRYKKSSYGLAQQMDNTAFLP
jgi:hypothetical protein